MGRFRQVISIRLGATLTDVFRETYQLQTSGNRRPAIKFTYTRQKLKGQRFQLTFLGLLIIIQGLFMCELAFL